MGCFKRGRVSRFGSYREARVALREGCSAAVTLLPITCARNAELYFYRVALHSALTIHCVPLSWISLGSSGSRSRADLGGE